MKKKGNLSTALSQFDKRPSVAGEMPIRENESPSPEESSRSKEYNKAKLPPSRQGKKALTGYFPPEVLKQLKLMAAAKDTTVQALLTEALNDLFKKHGKPYIA